MLVTTSLIWQTIWLEKSHDNESLLAWRLAHVVRILILQLLELEGIVKTMESGDLSLEDSLKYFEQGVQLTRQCQSALSEAEQKIALLSADDDYQTQKPLD